MTAAGQRAAAELAPADTLLDALEIRHPALPDPIRVVNDTTSLELEGETWQGVAFEARAPSDAEGRIPSAELQVDNVGRPLMGWIEAARGGAGATVRMMRVLVRPGAAPAVEWEVTTDVLSIRADQRHVTVRLGYDLLLQRPAVSMRFDPATAPGVF